MFYEILFGSLCSFQIFYYNYTGLGRYSSMIESDIATIVSITSECIGKFYRLLLNIYIFFYKAMCKILSSD